MVTVGVLLEIYRNTVLNWRAIDVTYGGLKAILYATTMNIHAELASFAVAHGWTVLEAPRLSAAGVHTCAHLCTPGWTVLEAPRLSAAGVPYLKEMYVDASRQHVNCTFYGYSNGDILYTRDLLNTLHAVAQVQSCTAGYVHGRRINIQLGLMLQQWRRVD